MNRAVIYATPGAWHAVPIASTGPPIAVLAQAVYGDAGYDPTVKPTFSAAPGPYDVTFAPNALTLPVVGTNLYASIRSLVIALRTPLDADLTDVIDVTHIGGTAQTFQYAFPRAIVQRDALRIRTVIVEKRFSTTYPGGVHVATLTPGAGVQVGPLRATFRAHT